MMKVYNIQLCAL